MLHHQYFYFPSGCAISFAVKRKATEKLQRIGSDSSDFIWDIDNVSLCQPDDWPATVKSRCTVSQAAHGMHGVIARWSKKEFRQNILIKD